MTPEDLDRVLEKSCGSPEYVALAAAINEYAAGRAGLAMVGACLMMAVTSAGASLGVDAGDKGVR